MNMVSAGAGGQGDLLDPNGSYDFRNPLGQPPASEDNALLASLTETAAFKRLEGVSFLGAINYSFVRGPDGSPSATGYTRAQHSLGVFKLALVYCECRALSPSERRLICAAALLHDIGHPPFSHSMESVWVDEFNIDHHKATQDIICGRIPLGRDVLDVLRAHHVDVERVAELVAGQVSDFDSFFSGPITFDTIEGISRAHQYLPAPSPSPAAVVIAATERASNDDQEVVDGFWHHKDEVYRLVVHSRQGILADFVSQEALRQHIRQVSIEDYFGDDQLMFKKLPGLKDTLTSTSMDGEASHHLGTPGFYVARTYFVDESGDFFSRNDSSRYQHVKSPKRIETAQRSSGRRFERRRVRQLAAGGASVPLQGCRSVSSDRGNSAHGRSGRVPVVAHPMAHTHEAGDLDLVQRLGART